MPTDNPQVGETWEMNDPLNSRVVRAVVIAVGGDALRVMVRTGRRSSMPLRSFLSLWRFHSEAPEPRLCTSESCENLAYFRIIDAGGDDQWICENHTPQGISVFLPSEDTRTDLELQVECPECRSTVVQRGSLLTVNTGGREYYSHNCLDCEASWFFIIGRGSETDGLNFAEDLSALAAHLNTAEIHIGFIARQSLTRAIGMRSANHLGGFTLHTDNQFGDNVALVLRRGRERVARIENVQDVRIELGSRWRLRASGLIMVVMAETPENVTIRTIANRRSRGFYQSEEGTFVIPRIDFIRDYEYIEAAPLPEAVQTQVENSLAMSTEANEGSDIVVGSTWRRRRIDNSVILCRVTNLSNGFVDYDIIHNPDAVQTNSFESSGPAPRMEESQFLEHWYLLRDISSVSQAISTDPHEGSFWRHIETRNIVRVAVATTSHRMQHQTPFVSLEGEAATTPTQTFQRLYREMPFPPTKVPWVLGNKAFRALSFDGATDYRNVVVTLEGEEGVQSVPLFKLMEDFTPMIFEDASKSSLDVPVRSKSCWVHETKRTEVRVLDVGFANTQEFVRFESPKDGVRILLLDDFIEQYLYHEPVAPTKVGDEWCFKERATYFVLEVNLDDQEVLLGRGEERVTVDFRKLQEHYSHVERRSAFSMLDDYWEDD